MRRVLAALGLVVALATAPAAAAQADVGVGLPVVPARSATVPPPGFSSNAEQAIAAAEAHPTMVALHRRQHPLAVEAFIWSSRRWEIDFSYRNTLVAEVDVGPSGRVAAVWTGPLALAPYARGHFAPLFSSPWVLVPFSILFLLPFLDPRRLRRRQNLDAAAVLSLLVSYVLFDHAHLQAAVWLVYPPLIYLLVRMLALGFGRGGTGPGLRSSSWAHARLLWGGLLLLVGARIALSLAAHGVIDVGYASVIGAHRIAHGQSLYFASVAHPDTYGPAMYLAYVPFELAFPWHGAWDYLASAHLATIVFDLATIAGLIGLGRRLRAGTEGTRLGLLLAWAWAACPFTLLGLIMHSNDGLIAMLAVLSLLAFASPIGRGALLGVAGAAKFFPLALLPLYASGRERSRRPAVRCVAACIVVVAALVAAFLPAGGLRAFYDHTIGYQLHRSDVFSLWSLHPALAPLKTALELCAALLAVAVAAGRRPRSLAQVSALAAAVTIALQLPSTHWFYYYAVWFLPYVFVALLGAPGLAAHTESSRPRRARTGDSEVSARAGVELTPA